VKRSIALLVAMTLVLAACGDDDVLQTAAPTTATTAAPTTVATTVAPSTTATTVTPTTTATTVAAAPLFPILFDGPNNPAFPPVLGIAGDPNGSGCVPGADVLPDGVWFGYAEAVSGGVITFDLACYFTGAAATAVSGTDCDTEFGEYCVRNVNPRTFAVAIAGTADAFYIEAGTWNIVPVAASAWPVSGSYVTCPGTSCGVWLYINGGVATDVVEMFEE